VDAASGQLNYGAGVSRSLPSVHMITLQRQILLGFELAGEQMATGRPFSVVKRFNYSMSPKATFPKYVEALLGRALTRSDLVGRDRFDVRALLGQDLPACDRACRDGR
jgi:hypothetical protein